MTQPSDLRARIVEALITAPAAFLRRHPEALASRTEMPAWRHAIDGAPGGHNYDGECALCRSDVDELADAILAVLGDQWAEDLAGHTGIKRLEIRDGVIDIGLEPAREILLVLCASARAWLDEHDAPNYSEAEIRTAKVEWEIHDGQSLEDRYVLTVQRKSGLTPHELRRKAERERDQALAEVEELKARLAAAIEGAAS